MLAAMFAPDGPFNFTKSSTSDSTPFIDRDGELFKYILQFLRDGRIRQTASAAIRGRLCAAKLNTMA
jgi:BTB/POZ domain